MPVCLDSKEKHNAHSQKSKIKLCGTNITLFVPAAFKSYYASWIKRIFHGHIFLATTFKITSDIKKKDEGLIMLYARHASPLQQKTHQWRLKQRV